MPPFRGALTLEEAWAIGRYLRTFVPGTEASRPDLGDDKDKDKTQDKDKTKDKNGSKPTQPKGPELPKE